MLFIFFMLGSYFDLIIGGLLNLISWPMIMLSGDWFSLEGAPPALKSFAEFLPLTHLVAGEEKLLLKVLP